MAINVYPVGEGPAPKRNKRRTLENSDEWLQLKSKMADGIKPFEEVAVTFNATDKAKLRIKGPQRVFRDMAKAWIRKAGLPYSVDAYKADGNDIIMIRNEPPLTNSNPRAVPAPEIQPGVTQNKKPDSKKRRA